MLRFALSAPWLLLTSSGARAVTKLPLCFSDVPHPPCTSVLAAQVVRELRERREAAAGLATTVVMAVSWEKFTPREQAVGAALRKFEDAVRRAKLFAAAPAAGGDGAAQVDDAAEWESGETAEHGDLHHFEANGRDESSDIDAIAGEAR